jgi:integrase
VRFPKTIKQGSAVVKVYRVKHRTAKAGCVYSVAYVIAGARRLQQFTDLDAALEEARLRVGQLATGRVEAASISKPDRDELRSAQQLAGKVPLLAALKEWRHAHDLSRGHVIAAAEAWAARNGQNVRPAKVSAVVSAFLKASTKAGKQVATDHASIFQAINTDLGAYDLTAVSASQLDRWLATRENPVSRNTYRKRIVAVWRWAQRKGFLPRDTKTEAEMTERAHEPAPVVGIISAKTFEKLLRFFHQKHPEYLPALVVAGFCGLRRSEVHAQKWDDINLEQKHLRVSKAKRGTPARRLVPLCDAAVEWLMLAPDKTEALCGNLAIDRIRHIAREARDDEKVAKFPAIPDNAFRHSYISHAVATTGDIPRVSLDSGNSPKEIQRHYRELVTKAEGDAWFTIRPPKIGDVVPITKIA